MRKLVVALFTIPISTGIAIWILMQGWGLQPANWSVIIWGAVLQFVVMMAMQIGMSDDK